MTASLSVAELWIDASILTVIAVFVRHLLSLSNDKNVFHAYVLYILIAFASFDLVPTADEFKGILLDGSENISLMIEP